MKYWETAGWVLTCDKKGREPEGDGRTTHDVLSKVRDSSLVVVTGPNVEVDADSGRLGVGLRLL